MRKHIIIFMLLLFLVHKLISQTLSLRQCYEGMEQVHPFVKQEKLLQAAYHKQIKSVKSLYLPQVMLNGQANYQSDVTYLDIDLPPQLAGSFDVPTPDHDTYKATIDVHQILYKGNSLAKNNALQETYYHLSSTEQRIKMYNVKKIINDLFLGIILKKKQINLMEATCKRLTNQYQKAQSGYEHGTNTLDNLLVLEAEILKAQQQIANQKKEQKSLENILSEYSGIEIDSTTHFQVPIIRIPDTTGNEREELKLFDLQQRQISQTQDINAIEKLPQLSIFGQAGYGKPGLNMLSNEFDRFYLVGLKLSWKIFDWNHINHKNDVLGFKSEIINTEEDNFLLNLKSSLQRNLTEIDKTEELLSKDEQIILIQEKITQTAKLQLEQGAISASDYIDKLKSENESKLNFEIHKIQLIKAKIDYLHNLNLLKSN